MLAEVVAGNALPLRVIPQMPFGDALPGEFLGQRPECMGITLSDETEPNHPVIMFSQSDLFRRRGRGTRAKRDPRVTVTLYPCASELCWMSLSD